MVLFDEKVFRNRGYFTKADLEIIWHEGQYASMRDELVQLMINFQLCYRIPETQAQYIAPQLLSENQPSYDWVENNNLIIRYLYEFLPKGIIMRFIVAMHSYIANQKYVWKRGVVLKKDETLAEIIEYYEKREIKIRISGKNKRNLLTIVTRELDKIHNSYHHLKYDKMIQ
jgi:hypothetical protein